jgi:hypothetical protein
MEVFLATHLVHTQYADETYWVYDGVALRRHGGGCTSCS